jgi:Phosphorylase superfamily
MSTIPEVVTAHHCNMQVLCLSLITNKVIMEGDTGPAANHAEVLEAVGKRSVQMQSFVKQIIKLLDQESLAKIPDLSPVALNVAKSQYDAKRGKWASVSGVSYETLLFGAACAVAGFTVSRMVRGKH